jgi:hypothetical protein
MEGVCATERSLQGLMEMKGNLNFIKDKWTMYVTVLGYKNLPYLLNYAYLLERGPSSSMTIMDKQVGGDIRRGGYKLLH